MNTLKKIFEIFQKIFLNSSSSAYQQKLDEYYLQSKYDSFQKTNILFIYKII